MGVAIISRGGGVGVSKAKVQIIAHEGAILTISQGEITFTRTAGVDPVEVSLGFGYWTISSSKGTSKTINIDVLKVYNVNVRDVTYGIAIDTSNGDPADACIYTDDAVGYSPLSCASKACDYGSWEEIITKVFGCRPCLYKNGARTVYLNPNNYAQTEDGAAADITSGNAGDVMVEFKKTWYKYAKEGNILTFQVANYDRSADGFVCTAFSSMDGNATIRDYMYYGAYEGYIEQDGSASSGYKIRSLSGKGVFNWDYYLSYSQYRDGCRDMGSSYGMEDWCKRYYILGLLMLVTKTRKIQDAIGQGNLMDGYENQSGLKDTAGLFSGSSNEYDYESVKCFGIENMWGNTYSWCDGIITLSSSTLGFKSAPPYNNTGEGYTEVADGYTRNSGLYPTDMIPIMDGAAITMSAGQSDSSKGWCDYAYVGSGSGYVAVVGGGYYGDAGSAGPFCVLVVYSPDYVGGGYCVGRLVSA